MFIIGTDNSTAESLNTPRTLELASAIASENREEWQSVNVKVDEVEDWRG